MGGAGGGEVGKAIYGGSVRVIHGGFSTLTFHSDELRSLAKRATGESTGYRFEVGQDRVRGLPVRVTWLVGFPES